MRRILGLIFVLFISAGLSKSQKAALYVDYIAPVSSWNISSNIFPSTILNLTRASNATYYNASGFITTASNDTARIDYDPSTLAARGLLIEPLAATNYCPYSSALSNWTAANGTATNNSGATLDPAGTNTATLINPTGGTITSLAPPAFTATVSTQYAASYFVKTGGAAYAGIAFYDNTNSALKEAIFDLSTGVNTFATAGVTALTSENIGNGWWRLSAVWTSAANTVSIIPVVYPHSTGVGGTPAASDKIYIWGPQYEKNFESSSYVANPSTGTTTRAGDNVQFIGPAGVALASPTFSAIIEARLKTANASGILLLGGAAAVGAPLYTVSAGTVRAYDAVRSTVNGDVSTGGATWLSGSRAGISASPSTMSIAMAGGTPSNYPSFGGAMVGGALGRYTDTAANPGTLWIKSFGIYNKSMSNGRLQNKSTVNGSY